MPESPLVTRFAPSPTGALHLGNVRTAFFNALLARRESGRFLLRIEDTDAARSSAQFSAALQDDLAWLGLHWDGEVLHQSARNALYQSHLTALRQRNRVYPCFCQPRELELAQALHKPKWRATARARGAGKSRERPAPPARAAGGETARGNCEPPEAAPRRASAA